MKIQAPHTLKEAILSFAKLYHEYRLQAGRYQQVRYHIVSTLEDYKNTQKIALSIADKPGDILPAMTLQTIKQSQDIIAGMHPVDINSINDLYYLSRDDIVEIRVSGRTILARTNPGQYIEYDVDDTVNWNDITSPRIAYQIGYMRAEKAMQAACKDTFRYKVIRDSISSLHVKDTQTKKVMLKRPADILFSEEYKLYPKEDIARIGYVCGQMSRV